MKQKQKLVTLLVVLAIFLLTLLTLIVIIRALNNTGEVYVTTKENGEISGQSISRDLSRTIITKVVDTEEINNSLNCSSPKRGSPLLDRFLGRAPRILIANLPPRFRLEQVSVNFAPELEAPAGTSATLHVPYEFSDDTAQDHAFHVFNANRPPLVENINRRTGEETILPGDPDKIVGGEVWLQLGPCLTAPVNIGQIVLKLTIAFP